MTGFLVVQEATLRMRMSVGYLEPLVFITHACSENNRHIFYLY